MAPVTRLAVRRSWCKITLVCVVHQCLRWAPRPCGGGVRAEGQPKEIHMAAKLYVGGLSYSTTSETLREYFAQCGTVESASVVTDKFSGQSRGFGFVELATTEED